jgi:hypothetical protein
MGCDYYTIIHVRIKYKKKDVMKEKQIDISTTRGYYGSYDTD